MSLDNFDITHGEDLYIDRFRIGTVLSRNEVLKKDAVLPGVSLNGGPTISGAANFRSTRDQVYGVGQPNYSGILTILTLLGCNEKARCATAAQTAAHVDHAQQGSTPPLSVPETVKHRCIWSCMREEAMLFINGEPFVLRDGQRPLRNINAFRGIDADRLEMMEQRLKADLQAEALKNNNTVLLHDELELGVVRGVWTTIKSILTPRELFQKFAKSDFRVHYIRIPISAQQVPTEENFDAILRIVREASPTTRLIFNCQMGKGRSTFAMIMARLIRQTQRSIIPDSIAPAMADLDALQLQQRALLRLFNAVEKGLQKTDSAHSAIQWTLARGSMIDQLTAAISGNYTVILSLLRILTQGVNAKRDLDVVIDECDMTVNLREVILLLRVQLSSDQRNLWQALVCLERYFLLITFADYLLETKTLHPTGETDRIAPVSTQMPTFKSWLKRRPEITSLLFDLRRKTTDILSCFRPIESLSALASSGSNLPPSLFAESMQNELERVVMRTRCGTVLGPQTILKFDNWSPSQSTHSVTGVANFRQIQRRLLFASAQPTRDGLLNILRTVRTRWQQQEPHLAPLQIHWFNLREEPLIYVNGKPFVLRDQYATLRNIRAYTGITPERLELVEHRLRQDIVAEMARHDNKILVHGESVQRQVIPLWERVEEEQLSTFRDLCEHLDLRHLDRPSSQDADNDEGASSLQDVSARSTANTERDLCHLHYSRVPVTAEESPEPEDFDNLLRILGQTELSRSAFIFNCQMGIGRSTMGTVMALLIIDWLEYYQRSHPQPQSSKKQAGRSRLLSHTDVDVVEEEGHGREGKTCSRNITDPESKMQKESSHMDSLAAQGRETWHSTGALDAIVHVATADTTPTITAGNSSSDDDAVTPHDRPTREKSTVAASLDVLTLQDGYGESLQRRRPHIDLSLENIGQSEISAFVTDMTRRTRSYAAAETPRRQSLRAQATLSASAMSNNYSRSGDGDTGADSIASAGHESGSQDSLFKDISIAAELDGDAMTSLSPASPASRHDSPQMRDNADVAPPTAAGVVRRQYGPILSLLRVLRHGLECKTIVDHTIDACGEVFNIRESIQRNRVKAERTADESLQKKYYGRCFLNLKRYFFLIAFENYLSQTEPNVLYASNNGHRSSDSGHRRSTEAAESDGRHYSTQHPRQHTFREWMKRHKELKLILREIDSMEPSILLPVHESRPAEGFALTPEVERVLLQRHGSILAPSIIIKSDHWPGSQKMSLKEKLSGAPNYRKVDIFADASHATDTLNAFAMQAQHCYIYGVGMPTKPAIKLVLERVGAVAGSATRLLWFCLREEPTIYVNGKPFGLRNWQDPLRNLESTGIVRERLENMEQRMKEDFITEAGNNGGCLLVHEEESTTSGLDIATVPSWETIQPGSVQTMQEAFNDLTAQGYQVQYYRLPITDEQTPLLEVYDEITAILTHPAVSKSHVIFNCQMGRGRTTTGMVIATIIKYVQTRQHTQLIAQEHVADTLPEKADGAINNDALMKQRYTDGDYRVILQLLKVLERGRECKLLVDRIIDLCSHVQNIREAIYVFKLRLDTLEVGTRKHQHLLEQGSHYLIRYFYLLVFANYILLELPHNLAITFKEWMSRRPEIRALVDVVGNDFMN